MIFWREVDVFWNIDVLREERAFTQRTLQDLSGVAASYISAIENGEVNLSLDVAERLCDALGVELHKMLKPYPPVE